MYTVLMPVDGDEDRARAAVETLTTMPFPAGELSVVVSHVFPEFEVADDSRGRVSSDELLDERDPPSSVALAADLLEEYGYDATVEVAEGDPAETILATASDLGADCIVMCSRRRSPAGKALFGSVTQEVLLDGGFPVMVVPEPGE